jgi:hypothetical protein
MNPSYLKIIWNQSRIIKYARFNENFCRFYILGKHSLNDWARWAPIELLLNKYIIN